MKMTNTTEKLVGSILHMVLLSFNGCIYSAKHKVGKPQLEVLRRKKRLNCV